MQVGDTVILNNKEGHDKELVGLAAEVKYRNSASGEFVVSILDRPEVPKNLVGKMTTVKVELLTKLFVAGDQVKVVRKHSPVHHHPEKRRNWNDEMDCRVGTTGTVESVDAWYGVAGVRIKFDSGPPADPLHKNGFFYFMVSLDHVVEDR